jgi:peptidoglycan/LPS O-acetylase OafA/YrhL
MQKTVPADVGSLSARHVPELDGVRAVAIWTVLAVHLFETPPANVLGIAMLPGVVRFTVHHGFLGVDAFFVLSGYLITGILLRTKQLPVRQYFARFYTRRARRIFPLYFLVLGLITLAAGRAYFPFLTLGALFSANLADVFHIAVPSPAGPFWSLAVEEQFYLVWPWLVLWLRRRILILVTIAIVILEPILRILTNADHLELTWYHCDGLAIGALLALLLASWNGDRRTIWRVIGVLVGTFVVLTLAAIPYGVLHGGRVANALRITQASLLFGALVAAGAGFSGAPALALLRTGAARITGKLSYCIYVIHRPLIDIYQAFAPKVYPQLSHFNPTEADVSRAVFVLICAYAIASLSWRYFESPILRGTVTFPRVRAR